MKKRALCIFLAVALLVSIPIFASADSTGVCFTAIGDTKLMDLNSMAVFSGGMLFVPSKAFSSYSVYTNYFDSDATALLYNSNRQIYFNLNESTAYDSLGNTYESYAILRGGQVYVPVSFICGYFGLSCSYISGNGYGDIIRIKNGGEVLTDSQFLEAATSLMKTRYNEYFGKATPTPQPSVSPTPENDDHSSTYVFLVFVGIPDTRLLDTLERFGYSASFFVTEEQANENPDVLRRIYGSGHNLGIYCESSAEECATAQDAIFAACQVLPGFVSSASAIAESCREYGSEHALAYFSPDISVESTVTTRSGIETRLDKLSGYVGLSVALGEESLRMLPSLLSYLSTDKYSVVPLRETYL